MQKLMITGTALVEQTRTWINTPYHHAGRVKGPQGGVDCIGLIVGAARELGVHVPFDTTAYGRGDNLALMADGLAKFCDRLDNDVPSRQPGDILILRGGSILHHVALYSGDETDTMIHVYNTVGKVVETPVTEEWLRLLHLVFRLKGN